MGTFLRNINEPNYKVICSLVFALIMGTALLILAYNISQPNEYYCTCIICISGLILGWLIGIITTPYDAKDEKKIGNFSKLIGTFLSGYLLSKFDRITSELFDPKTFLASTTGIRFLLFISFFVLSWIVVFVFRMYTVDKIRNP